jgi:parallel beta-helix repeat protein
MERVPLFITILLTAMLSLFLITTLTDTEARTIIVDDDWTGADYNNISAAVGAANHGDTILVHSGLYNESLDIEISITLIGNGSSDTFLGGGSNVTDVWDHHIINVYTGDIVIQGFHFSWDTDLSDTYGIFIQNYDCQILQCVFQEIGIAINDAHPLAKSVDIRDNLFDNSRILVYTSGNEISNNTFSNGMIIIHGNGNHIINNTFTHDPYVSGLSWGSAGEAIVIDNSGGTEITGNVVHFYAVGIELTHTRDTLIDSNQILNCSYGIDTICYSHNLTISHNTFSGNGRAIFVSSNTDGPISDNQFIDNRIDIEYQEESDGPYNEWNVLWIAVAVVIIIVSVIVAEIMRRRPRRGPKGRSRIIPRYRSRRRRMDSRHG